MTDVVTNVLRDALNLPPVERAELIERLFQSFDHTNDRAVDSAWKKEIESRFDAYDRGEIKASSSDEMFARVNRR